MKPFTTFIKTIIITLTSLVVILFVLLFLLSALAKGCEEAVKGELNKLQTKELQDTTKVKYEIISIDESQSFDPKRFGKTDIRIMFSIEGYSYKIKTFPKEEFTKEILVDYINEYFKRLQIDVGEGYKVISMEDLPSFDQKRIGKIDVNIAYKKEGQMLEFVKIPKEEESPERIRKAILENEERKKELRKLIEP